MTRDQAEALGKRALAAGFVITRGRRRWGRHGSKRMRLLLIANVGYAPDLRDAATRGILLEQVREAWEDPNICVSRRADLSGWRVWHFDGNGWTIIGLGDTEIEALVCALEAKP